MPKSRQSSTIKLKPEGLWSSVLSEHIHLTIKTSSAMQINGIAMKLSSEVEYASIVQHARTAVYIEYLRGASKRRQRSSACLGVLLPFSQQQMAIDLILDPGAEVTLYIKGPYEVTVLGRFLPTYSGNNDGIEASETVFTTGFQNSNVTSETQESGPSNHPGPSHSQNMIRRSSSRALSTASQATDKDYSPAVQPHGHGRHRSWDSASATSSLYYDANDHDQDKGGTHRQESSTGPKEKKARRD